VAENVQTLTPNVTDETYDADASYESTHGDEPGDLPDDRYLDRELSWLAFNERVLELAENPELPLLDRVRFLAIFASNLDEFFMVRVAGLKRRIAAGVAVRAASGLRPREVLDNIWRESQRLMRRHSDVLHDSAMPELAEHGIELVRWEALTSEERDSLGTLFAERVFPVLTPLAVDPAHPFPYISGLSLNLAVIVRHPGTETEHFARVKVPPNFSRWLPLGQQRFVPLEDVIAAHLDMLFPGMRVVGHHAFG
jgi:polyphosphate kinase